MGEQNSQTSREIIFKNMKWGRNEQRSINNITDNNEWFNQNYPITMAVISYNDGEYFHSKEVVITW